MKLDRGEEEMYQLQEVIVSGSHLVFDADRGWVSVDSHPYAVLINEPVDRLICITTSTKTIRIGGMVFCDWDDLNAREIAQIAKNRPVSLQTEGTRDVLHCDLEAGFAGSSNIPMADGRIKKLRAVAIGDILKGGHRVIGTVVVSTKQVNNVGRYFIGDNEILAGPNFTLCDRGRALCHSADIQFEPVALPVLYNLITDTHSFPLENIFVGDYDSRLDLFFDPIDLEVPATSKNFL
jgi:hypothetical protein